MKQIRILLADTDEEYVTALVQYLLSRENETAVHFYTNTDAFSEDLTYMQPDTYDLALLSGEFLQEADRTIGVRYLPEKVGRVLWMDSGRKGEEGYGFERIMKFGPASAILDEIRRLIFGRTLRVAEAGIMQMQPTGAFTAELKAKYRDETTADANMLAIYSPIHHDLLLPFTLLICRMMAQEEQVILVDMEENSRLSGILDRCWKGTLTDYMYLRESGEGNLKEFLIYEDNIAILPPVDSPLEIARISEEQWDRLANDLRQTGAKVVWLFGTLHQGTQTILERSSRLIVVGKQEDYYSRVQENAAEAVRRQFPHLQVEEVNLPMSVSTRTSGNWNIADLPQSNLASFVSRYAMGQRKAAGS